MDLWMWTYIPRVDTAVTEIKVLFDYCHRSMNVPEHIRYLLRLLPRYREIGGERYILSKILRIEPDGNGVWRMYFCGKCLSVYVPVVNCKVRCDDALSVECFGCGKVSVFRDVRSCGDASSGAVRSGGDLEGDGGGEYRFEDYFN